MSDAHQTLLHRWFEEVWNKGRSEAIAELLAPGVVIHGLSDDEKGPPLGIEGFEEFHAKFRAAFPDLIVNVEDTIQEGDKLVARCSVRGRHTGDALGFAATQAPVEFTGVAIVRIEDGKIAEAWNNFDFMTLYKQLGVM